MEKNVEILAYHGWGFDGSFWDSFKKVIPESVPFKTANRGYFDKPFHPRFNPDTNVRVVFTHSFGLHWCNSGILSKADYLVMFNGFGEFHPKKEKYRAISKKGLARMISELVLAPEKVLKLFYGNVFYPGNTLIKVKQDLDKQKLAEDLKELDNTRFPLIDLDFGSVMIALDSGKDQVLMQPRGKEMTAGHLHKKYVKVYDAAGHALPLTNPEDCWSYLCSIIPIFERHENNR